LNKVFSTNAPLKLIFQPVFPIQSMQYSRQIDTLLHVVVPVFAGGLLYLAKMAVPLTGFVNNHLADGLWAYVLMSAILIIWNRQLHIVWMAAVPGCGVVFELLQQWELVKGTADVYDCCNYIAFSGIAILVNFFITQKSAKMQVKQW